MENNQLLESIVQKLDILLERTSKVIIPRLEDFRQYTSEHINELATALAKAQAIMPIAGRTSENPFFKSKYADLAEIVRTSRPALTQHGLSVTQIPIENDSGFTLITMLMHTSGQYVSSTMRIKPAKSDPQSMGSCLSYAKRYAYGSLIGVVSGDEDDDAELAVAPTRYTEAKGTALNTKYNPRETNSDTITKEQLQELEYELADHTDVAEQVLEGLKIRHLADMPRVKFIVSINRIREIIRSREGK